MYLIEDEKDKVIVEEYRIINGDVEIKNIICVFKESLHFDLVYTKTFGRREFDFFSIAKNTKITKLTNKEALAYKILYGQNNNE